MNGSAKDCLKLRLRLKRETGKRESPTLHFRRSMKNLNLSDFKYAKQLGWADQAHRDKTRLCHGELDHWQIGSSKKLKN